MNVSALLTSAGINICISLVLLSFYSVLRKQPSNANVYFGCKLAQQQYLSVHPLSFNRFVPSIGWIVKAWKTTEEEILASSGLDAVAFIRMIVFSIRIFSIASVVCVFGVLPLNYYGEFGRHHLKIPSESLEVFTIANVDENSRWLWVHCLALYIISVSACILLYSEYNSIAKLRLVHITQRAPNPSHFTVLVRSIPQSVEGSLTDRVKNFFTKYHASSYLSHQMIYRAGKVHKLMTGAEKFCGKIYHRTRIVKQNYCSPVKYRCGLCGGTSDSMQYYRKEFDLNTKANDLNISETKLKECSAAFVFFKTRYAALVASKVTQSSNPMLWATDLAPEPHDVYWSNLWIPYRQLWLRRIVTILGSIVFMVLFLFPVTLVQGLTQLDQLQKRFPFLKGMLKKKYISQVVTGYLPSVILLIFMYAVPPTMMRFSAMEGPISRSLRKRSACYKVLWFNVWNVFFVNVLSGSIIHQINTISTPNQVPLELAKAVPNQATFFITYVLTSGWTSLSSEIIQLFALIWNFIRKFVLGKEDDPASVLSFPYHTEVPRVLLLGLFGFTCAILAPLILPFLLVYFLLGYVVYRNQIINVYVPKHETGGQLWPIAHNTTIFSLLLAQIIALGVFGIKKSPVASGFIIPLLICTLLFNEYCRQRFLPVFKNFSAQDIMDMDTRDQNNGIMDEIHQQLLSSYCQFSPDISGNECEEDEDSSNNTKEEADVEDID